MKFVCSALLFSSSIAAPLTFETEQTLPARRISEDFTDTSLILATEDNADLDADSNLSMDELNDADIAELSNVIDDMTDSDWADFFEILTEEFVDVLDKDSRNLEDLTDQEFEDQHEK